MLTECGDADCLALDSAGCCLLDVSISYQECDYLINLQALLYGQSSQFHLLQSMQPSFSLQVRMQFRGWHVGMVWLHTAYYVSLQNAMHGIVLLSSENVCDLTCQGRT